VNNDQSSNLVSAKNSHGHQPKQGEAWGGNKPPAGGNKPPAKSNNASFFAVFFFDKKLARDHKTTHRQTHI